MKVLRNYTYKPLLRHHIYKTWRQLYVYSLECFQILLIKKPHMPQFDQIKINPKISYRKVQSTKYKNTKYFCMTAFKFNQNIDLLRQSDSSPKVIGGFLIFNHLNRRGRTKQ